MSYQEFYNYISPRVVSQLVQIINNIFNKSDDYKDCEYIENNGDFEFRLKHDEYDYVIFLTGKEKSKKIEIYKDISKTENNSVKKEPTLIMRTLFLDLNVIEQLNKEYPLNTLLEKKCKICDLKNFWIFLKDIKIQDAEKAFSIHLMEAKIDNKELHFIINQFLNDCSNFQDGDYINYFDYFEYSSIHNNDEYKLSYIFSEGEFYFFEKNKKVIKVFNNGNYFGQLDDRFDSMRRRSKSKSKEKDLKDDKSFLKKQCPILEINNKIVNNNLTFRERIIPIILHLYIKNKIEIPLPFNKSDFLSIMQHTKYLDLNNMYVDLLWNTESKTKWIKGEHGYYLSIDSDLLNFTKSSILPKLQKDQHTPSISSFNKNANILKLPKNIVPEWADFAKKSYEYVLKNHRNFKFSNLKDSDFENVSKAIDKAFK